MRCAFFLANLATNITQEIILNMFFEILNIKTPEWCQTFIAERRLTNQSMFIRSGDHVNDKDQEDIPQRL